MALNLHRTWRRGGRATLAAAVLLFLVANTSPLRPRRHSSKFRRLTEDAALSAALDGLPVAPSAKAPSLAGVNVYGLDPSLLAALQGSTGTPTAAKPPAMPPATPPVAAPQGGPPANTPAAAPRLTINSSAGQSASTPDQALRSGSAAAPPKSTQYAPLDPYLAAALENQGRSPEGNATGAPGPAAAGAAAAPAPALSTSSNSSSSTMAPSSGPAASVFAGTASAWAAEQEQLQAFCNDPGWQASTLKLLQEAPFASLFEDLGEQTSFDPTGLEHVNNAYYVVFNRSQTVAYVANRLEPLDVHNKLLPASDSANITDYAGIAYRKDTGEFMAVQEHYPHNTARWGAGLRPEIFNLALSGELETYAVQERCWVAFSLSTNVTGFQDIQYYSDGKGGQWLLGLCSGNHCASGDLGQDRGNGRVVVSAPRQNGTHCAWVPQRVLSLPATAAFSQFSGLAIRGSQILVSSKLDSAVWLGGINWDTWQFSSEGLLLHLPRNDACQSTYCNVGAVQWIDDQRITIASGIAVPGDPWPCHSKSESLSQFQLPQAVLAGQQSGR